MAAFLGVHRETVAERVRAHAAGGDNGLAAKPHPGRPPFLTPEQKKPVPGWRAESPATHGFRTDRWTANRVAPLILPKLEVEFHPHYLREWSTKRNCTPQKPTRRAKRRNPEAIAAWLQKDGPRIKKSPPPERPPRPDRRDGGVPQPAGAAVVGGAGPDPGDRRGHRKKVSVIGAVTVAPQARRPGRYFATRPDGSFTADAVAPFPRDRLKHPRGQVPVPWDGGPNRAGPLIRAFLTRNRRLTRERLPAYAPDRNPVEVVGSWLRYGQLANDVPDGIKALDNEIRDRLIEWKCDPSVLRNLWDGSDLPFPQLRTG